jgi:2-C-methyl-D-erythritol 4-phosphate cytidylyltransferase
VTAGAIVLAGGSGRRVGLGHNKTLAVVADRTLLEWSVTVLAEHVDRIVVVARPADRADIVEVVGSDVAVVDGGATRHASERAGLAAVGDVDVVAVHDGARPVVAADLVRRVLSAAEAGHAVVPGEPRSVPVAHWDAPDGAVVLHDAMLVDRSRLVGVQTPQAAPAEVLRAAFAAAERAAGATPTDTVEPVLQHCPGVDVVVVAGDPRNLKVTWPTDVERVRELLTSPGRVPRPASLRLRPGRPTGGAPPADLEVDGVTPVTDSLRAVADGRVVRAVDRSALVDVRGDLLVADPDFASDAADLGAALEAAVLAGATLRLRRRR